MDDSDLVLCNDQVMIRSGDVHPAILEGVAVLRVAGREAAHPGKDFWQHAAAARKVKHDQH